MVHDRLGPAVEQDVAKLLGDVPVVDVDADRPGLGGAQEGLQVLVAVVEVEGDVVVRRLPALTCRERPVRAEPGFAQHGGEPPAAVGDVAPAEATVAPHQALALGDLGRDRLVQRRQVELLGHARLAHRRRSAGVTGP